MNITFKGVITPGYDSVMVNMAIIKLYQSYNDVKYIYIDRDTTRYDIEDGKINMTWENVYVYNPDADDETEYVTLEEEDKFINADFCGFIYEDESPNDYRISITEFNGKNQKFFDDITSVNKLMQKVSDWYKNFDYYDYIDKGEDDYTLDEIIENKCEKIIELLKDVVDSEYGDMQDRGEALILLEMIDRYNKLSIPKKTGLSEEFLKGLDDYLKLKSDERENIIKLCDKFVKDIESITDKYQYKEFHRQDNIMSAIFYICMKYEHIEILTEKWNIDIN